MIFSFAPMLAMFNEDIRRISDIFYTQQLKCVFDQMSLDGFGTNGAMIVCVNAVICVIMFAVAYRKKGLE
jgi:ABC-2 type transport system permease protein